jgi:hypothetical protein
VSVDYYKLAFMIENNIFIDNSKLEKYNLTSFLNGLSDHEAQFLEIYNIN